jgi:hypothetical protein
MSVDKWYTHCPNNLAERTALIRRYPDFFNKANTDQPEWKKYYREKAKLWHTDKSGGNLEQIQLLNRDNDVIKDCFEKETRRSPSSSSWNDTSERQRRQEEMERQRRQEEMERQRRQEEMERKRRQEEMERQRRQEYDESERRKRREAEKVRQQQEEKDRKAREMLERIRGGGRDAEDRRRAQDAFRKSFMEPDRTIFSTNRSPHVQPSKYDDNQRIIFAKTFFGITCDSTDEEIERRAFEDLDNPCYVYRHREVYEQNLVDNKLRGKWW